MGLDWLNQKCLCVRALWGFTLWCLGRDKDPEELPQPGSPRGVLEHSGVCPCKQTWAELALRDTEQGKEPLLDEGMRERGLYKAVGVLRGGVWYTEMGNNGRTMGSMGNSLTGTRRGKGVIYEKGH